MFCVWLTTALLNIALCLGGRHQILEIIADNLNKAGWSLGWVSALDLERRTILIVDAHEDDGKHLVVHADEKLTAFVELERAMHAFAVSLIS